MEIALQEPEEVQLSTTGPLQSAILRVCSQLRQDYIGVYYDVNEFELVIDDYDAASVVRPLALFFTYREDDKSCSRVVMSGVRNWENLVEWLRLTHQNWLPRIPLQCAREDWVIILQMFKIMEEMRSVDWKITKKVLQTFRVPLGDLDVDWLGDPLDDE